MKLSKAKKKKYCIILLSTLALVTTVLLGYFIILGINVKQDTKPIKNIKQVWALYNPLFGNPVIDKDYIGWKFRRIPYFDNHNNVPLDIPSQQFPQIGLYSTHDYDVLHHHLQRLNEIGVDGLLVQWTGFNTTDGRMYAPINYSDTTIHMLLNISEQYNISIAVCLQNSDDRFEKDIRAAINFVLKDFAKYKSYLRYDSKPVIMIYDQFETNGYEGAIIETLNKDEVYFIGTASKKDHVVDALEIGFGAISMYWPVVDMGWLAKLELQNETKDFFINKGIKLIPSVGPGYNDSKLNNFQRKGYGRQNGKRYIDMWNFALSFDSDVVTINSFNNWLESTEIEPAESREEYPFTSDYWSDKDSDPNLYLRITKEYIAKFKGLPEFQ